MIKFSAASRETGRPCLGIGLSKENCDRLLEGQPIQFSTEGMGLPVLEILILAGATELSITADLVKVGALRPDQIVLDPTMDVHPDTSEMEVD